MIKTTDQKVYQACLQVSALQKHLHAHEIAGTLAAAIRAVDPYIAVASNILREENLIKIGQATYDLKEIRQLKVIGAGKAAISMLQAVVDILGDQLSGGCVITKCIEGKPQKIGPVNVLEGSHPIPGERSLHATRQLLETLRGNQPDDLVICLLSGGGSALMTTPIGGVSLADMQTLTAQLLGCGATINEMNTLRKHLDAVKGGRLAQLAFPAQMACLILSDVVGNPLDIVASGPTVPDPSSYANCWEIVTRYRLQGEIPGSIRTAVQMGRAGKLPETPKPQDLRPQSFHPQNLLIGSNRQAALAGLAHAQKRGYQTLLLTTYLQGEARCAGQLLSAIARQVAESGEPLPRPACIAVGGETTVTLHGSGRGGRNQELALGSVNELAGVSDCLLVTFATDGEDGPTHAAGAVVTGETLVRANQLGLDPNTFLRNNDAYTFFSALGDLLIPGPTGTNVNDLAFLWLF